MRAHLHSEGKAGQHRTVHIQMQQTNQRNLNLEKPSVTYNINMPTEGHGNGYGTETQLSHVDKLTGMYDRPRPHERLLVKDRT